MMWMLIVAVAIWAAYGIAAYQLGKTNGHNQSADDLPPLLNDLYDKAFDNGYSKGYDDGAAGLESAVAALRAWGDDCQPD